MEGSNPFQPLAGVVGAVCVVLVSAGSRRWELELLELFSSPGWVFLVRDTFTPGFSLPVKHGQACAAD